MSVSLAAIVAAVLSPRRRVLAFDSFTRADNAGSLGNAESGQAWATSTGNAFGISSNQAYNTDTSNTVSIASVDVGATDVRVVCSVTRTTQIAGVVFRLVDGSNYWSVNLGGASTTLVKTVSGSPTTVATLAQAFSGASLIEVIARGPAISVLVNGVALPVANDAALAAGTRCGLFRQQTVNNSRHDNFLVERA